MPFESLAFRHTWRPYQQRVLDAIEDHLSDNRLHVVAAPGAGKTTLGLEIFRRLKKPALVLSPTRVIRDQWIDRLSDFSNTQDMLPLPWVSKNINAPAVLTSITYQSIHHQLGETLKSDYITDSEHLSLEEADMTELSELKDEVTTEELDKFIAVLKYCGIGVIILDEAHHLRSEWWRALDKVCQSIPDITLISLTATPPYDSQDVEWQRYEQLCGPIDEEISIPELVKAGTLCPHQDYIWAVNASTTEKHKIAEHDQRVSALCNTLIADATFEEIVLSHPWISRRYSDSEILNFPELAITLLTFLKHKQLTLPESLLTELDLLAEDVPELSRHWWQVLVEAVLFSNSFELNDAQKEYASQLKKQLRATELLHQSELSLERSRRLERSLSQSCEKVNGCIDVHILELEQRRESLRQVILVDYIRDEALVSGLNTGSLTLGAWPIFGGLIKRSPIPKKLGLLTGRLSLIPYCLSEKFLQFVDRDQFKLERFESANEYLKVIGPLNQQTTAYTQLLIKGDIATLVGTRSLLGEGWDAPVINSLILASSVDSYMLTNQMRGRAIRIDRLNPNKISSIWHLVAVDEKSLYSGWSDFLELRKRFNTFVGLSERNPTIESGYERMNSSVLTALQNYETIPRIQANNRQMKARYAKFHDLTARWQKALTLDASARVIPSVNATAVSSIKTYHIKNTLKYLLGQIAAAIFIGVNIAIQLHVDSSSKLMLLLSIAVLGGMLYKLPQTVAAIRILLKHLPPEGSLKQIGLALTESLCSAGLIETSIRRMKVNVSQNYDGTFFLALWGSTFYESSLFADCMAEILAPVDNPRYLVIREGKLYGLKRDDYHAVPLKLGTKKELAALFYKSWCKYVGPSELVYTRTEEGKTRLVKAKMKAYSSVFAREIKRQDRWQAED